MKIWQRDLDSKITRTFYFLIQYEIEETQGPNFSSFVHNKHLIHNFNIRWAVLVAEMTEMDFSVALYLQRCENWWCVSYERNSFVITKRRLCENNKGKKHLAFPTYTAEFSVHWKKGKTQNNKLTRHYSSRFLCITRILIVVIKERWTFFVWQVKLSFDNS